jgi:hypothetical protein
VIQINITNAYSDPSFWRADTGLLWAVSPGGGLLLDVAGVSSGDPQVL